MDHDMSSNQVTQRMLLPAEESNSGSAGEEGIF